MYKRQGQNNNFISKIPDGRRIDCTGDFGSDGAEGVKQRLDTILVERGLVTGRDRAKAAIAAGWVYIGGQRAVKAGAQYPAEVEIDFRGEDMKYVSRGGYKLERADSVFEIVDVYKRQDLW